MNVQVNGWVLLALVVVLTLSYAFSFVNMKIMVPAVSAQIGANQQLINQVNQVLQQTNEKNDARISKIETRIETIEKMK